MASSPPPSLNADGKLQNGSEATGPVRKMRSFDRLDDSSSVTSISSASRPAACSICKEPESKPTKPFIKCQFCRRDFHPCCPQPPVLNKEWMDEKFKYYCGYRKCQERLASKASASASKSTTPSTSWTPSKTQQRAAMSSHETSYGILSSPGAFRDSKKTSEFSSCEEPGCQAPVFTHILSKERLCPRHKIEKKSREANKAKALLNKPTLPSKGINKHKLHHLRPDDRKYAKRKKSSSGKVHLGSDGLSPNQSSPTNPKERPNLTQSYASPVSDPPPVQESEVPLFAGRHTTNNTISNPIINGPKESEAFATDSTNIVALSLRISQHADITPTKSTPSPEYEPPSPTAQVNETIWSQEQELSNSLDLSVTEKTSLRSVSASTSASVGQTSTKRKTLFQGLSETSSKPTNSAFLSAASTRSRQPYAEDEILSPDNLAYIDEIAANHPDSPAKQRKVIELVGGQNPSVGLLNEILSSHDSDVEMDLGLDPNSQLEFAPTQTAVSESEMLQQRLTLESLELAENLKISTKARNHELEHLEPESEQNSQIDSDIGIDVDIETNEAVDTEMLPDSDDDVAQSNPDYLKIFAPASPSLLLLQRAHQKRVTQVELSDLDTYLQMQADSSHEQEGMNQLFNQQFNDSQVWAACDPRKVWTKAQPDTFWDEKRKEIIARPRRKANFGVLLAEHTKRDRLERDWDIHQTRERSRKEESRIAKNYEGIFGVPFWDDSDTLRPLDSDAKKRTSMEGDLSKSPGKRKKKVA